MSQPEDQLDTLNKRLNQLHQAQVEMKERQVTAEDSKRMEQTLKANIKATEDLMMGFRNMSNSISVNVTQATGSLSYAKQQVQREASQFREEHYRKLRRVALFSAIAGVVLGAVLCIIALDYHNARTFQDSLKGMFGEQVCRQAGGDAMIINKTGERVCAISLR